MPDRRLGTFEQNCRKRVLEVEKKRKRKRRSYIPTYYSLT